MGGKAGGAQLGASVESASRMEKAAMKTLISALVMIAAVGPTPKETYWRLVASYHAQNAALQSSYTSQQKAMQEKLADISRQISDARAVVKKGCEAQGGTFEVTDTDIVCKDKTDANHK